MNRAALALAMVLAGGMTAFAQAQLPSEAPLPAPAGEAVTPPAGNGTAGAKDGVDPERFGGERRVDPAYGAFQRGLYRTALNLALPRAEGGDPHAQTLVAEILARGLGIRRNEAEAARWYALASEQGIPEAQFQYALLLIDGRFVPRDEKGAFALMEAAAEAGNALAQFNLAQLLVGKGAGEAGFGRAADYYRRAAEQGLPDAQYALALLLANGTGGIARDEVKAREWLVKAARENYDTAQLDLGTWMVTGRGGTRDMNAGFAWIHRAATAGNVAAQNRLAKLYVAGLGTEPDVITGAAWYIVARRAGLRDAEMDDVMNGLTTEETQQALERANRLR
ncbi:MAG: sel1 repeat family protein [Rhizobiaceae bacterium]|nr:sel1 repeat family protein [Rhizobiaceae bacterium]